ncbi:MAG: amidohydrolase family protein [Streptosporangiales bacterium]
MNSVEPAADPTARARTRPRGVALRGAFSPVGGAAVLEDAAVVVDAAGVVAAYGPATVVDLPEGIDVVDGGWVGPALADAHVHLAFGGAARLRAAGVLAVRDLGARPDDARAWRDPDGTQVVTVAGPVLTAPGGYPSRSWGSNGFARFLGSPGEARRAVANLATTGVDVIKVALEPGGGLPVPPAPVVAAVVDAAHEAGLRVTCHALTAEMVTRALDAGADELAHVPMERLPTHLVARLALEQLPVVSTARTLMRSGGPQAEGVLGNLRALVGAGVPLVYGTDLGNEGTSPVVDVGELAVLAEAGLGPHGALRAATEGAARVVSPGGSYTGRVAVGETARIAVLAGDPVADPRHWRRPVAVVAGPDVVRPGAEAGSAVHD